MICSKLRACSFRERKLRMLSENGHEGFLIDCHILYLQLETDRFEWNARKQEDDCHGQCVFLQARRRAVRTWHFIELGVSLKLKLPGPVTI